MQRRIVRPGDDLSALTGAVLCRDLTVPRDGKPVTLRRGLPLAEVLPHLTQRHDRLEIAVVVPEAGEIAQPEASAYLAGGIAGPGVALDPPHQGQVSVRAATTGLLRVDSDAVSRLNRSGVALVATALDGRVVSADEIVAIVKAPALFVEEAQVEHALAALQGRPVIRVVPFRVQRVALVAGTRIRPLQLEVATRHLSSHLERFGARLVTARHLGDDDPDEIAHAYRSLLHDGAEFLLIAGSIMLDPEDPFIVAARRLRARVASVGAPIDPGTMFWVAYAGQVPLFGLASCELYGRLSVFDLLLPYALAGEPITRGLLADLGYGGLLVETQHARRPPGWYRKPGDSEASAPVESARSDDT
jgi:hypothetical protein